MKRGWCMCRARCRSAGSAELAGTNAGNNKDSNERLPDITYVPGEGPTVNAQYCNIISNVKNTKINDMNGLKSKIANTHYYTIEFSYDDVTGLVKSVKITY